MVKPWYKQFLAVVPDHPTSNCGDLDNRYCGRIRQQLGIFGR